MTGYRVEVPYVERFAQIPQWWLEHYAPKATHLQFRVYVVTRSYAYGNKQYSWPSNTTIATQCDCKPRSVPRVFEYWEQQQVLERKEHHREDGKRMPNRIIFLIPHEMQTHDPTMTSDAPSQTDVPTMTPGSGRPCPQGQGDHDARVTRIIQEESHNDNQTRQDVSSGYQAVFDLFSNMVGRTALESEKRFLISLVDEWSTDDVERAIIEYYLRKSSGIKSPTRYIKGVLENCANEGGRI